MHIETKPPRYIRLIVMNYVCMPIACLYSQWPLYSSLYGAHSLMDANIELYMLSLWMSVSMKYISMDAKCT